MILDKKNPIPLYHQIKNYLMNQIKEEKLKEGDRRFQLVVIDIERVELEEVEDMENKNRGGFGATGE